MIVTQPQKKIKKRAKSTAKTVQKARFFGIINV